MSLNDPLGQSVPIESEEHLFIAPIEQLVKTLDENKHGVHRWFWKGLLAFNVILASLVFRLGIVPRLTGNRILQRINAILSQLDQMTAAYVREDIADQFKIGSALALADLRKLKLPDLDGEFTDFYREAVKQTADNARLRFDCHRRSEAGRHSELSEATKEHICWRESWRAV